MRETAGDALSRFGINPLTDWLVHLRNRESLRRLKRIAETGVVKPGRRSRAPGTQTAVGEKRARC